MKSFDHCYQGMQGLIFLGRRLIVKRILKLRVCEITQQVSAPVAKPESLSLILETYILEVEN